MPYILKTDGRREALRKGNTALTAGELNYQIFYFVKHTPYLGRLNRQLIIGFFVMNFLGNTPNYQNWNDMTGC